MQLTNGSLAINYSFSITTFPGADLYFIDGGHSEEEWSGAPFSLLVTSKIRKRSQTKTEALEAVLIRIVKGSMGATCK